MPSKVFDLFRIDLCSHSFDPFRMSQGPEALILRIDNILESVTAALVGVSVSADAASYSS